MKKEFKVSPYYYDQRKIFKKNTVVIEDGLTVLVGCNGSGKSTLLQIIKEQLKAEKIPCLLYDNLRQGGSFALQNSLDNSNIELMASLIGASEGEAISINLMNFSNELRKFIETGLTPDSKWANFWSNKKQPTKVKTNKRFILFDALDSGLSIDQVKDLKEYILHNLINTTKQANIDLNIVVVANEYELCRGEKCLCASECSYVDINSYESYEKVIMQTRKYKDKSGENYVKRIRKTENL